MSLSFAEWVYWIGSALEVFGLWIGVRGIRRTWSEHPADGPFFAPVRSAIARARDDAGRFARRLLRRKPQTQTVHLSSVDVSVSALAAQLIVGWGPLPDFATDPEAAVTEVQKRLDTLHRTVQDLEHGLYEQQQAAKATEDALRAEFTARIDEAKTLTHRVAVGGLREQALGWSLIFVGFVLQMISQGLQFHIK